ncbi:cell division protein FtsZ [Novispirillum sp. DQ9]|uniref:cell division protein FtsZ n=1 Tax=Novispirillum sp. DQ9 TaxID=3398612 RepID=UPI003C7E6261
MINLSVPQMPEPSMKPCITVVGVGGAGGNAVNNMIADNLQGVDFVVANTDAQALSLARTERRIQLGADTTKGLGAGARPEIGRAAAEETYEIVAEQLQGSNMVFITAGMGGGTGTGAAPVIARVAREMGILTVGVVTKPFQFEGAHRMRLAESGIEELSQYVDTLIIIPNQNLFRVANEKTTFADAFKMADDVLNAGVRSITDLMIMPGLINLDFADVRTVMSDMGRAMMGTGEAAGDRRALDAAEAAIANPLLEDTCMKGAKGVLINITGGPDVTLFEVDEAANRIRDEVEGEAHIIFGSCFDQDMEGKMRVSVVATGISGQANVMPRPAQHPQHVVHAPRVTSAAPAPAHGQPKAEAPAAPMAQAPTAAHAAAPTAHAPMGQPQPAGRAATVPVFDEVREAEAARYVQAEAPRMTGTTGTATYGHAASQHAPHAAQPAPARQQVGMDLPASKPQDSFIPAPPVGREAPVLGDVPAARPAFTAEQRAEARPAVSRPAAPMAGQPAAPMAVQRPVTQPSVARTEPKAGGIKALFSRLTHQAQTEEIPVQEKLETHPRAAAPQPELTASPADRPAQSQDDGDELEIPAFLRRQAN